MLRNRTVWTDSRERKYNKQGKGFQGTYKNE